jgi:APA family basic amino acid/polyamine antiporter
MAEARELPRWLGKIHPRSRSPRRAALALGFLSAGTDLVFDLRPLIEVAGSFMLAWYFITHYAALQLPAAKRLTSPAFAWYGIAGCIGLTVAMPRSAVLAAAGTLATLTVIRVLLRRVFSRRRSA